ncbi:MAG: hypothetical protein IPK60_09375 [Sandaracinaceae bacterium]|nr:hypothetical protein [Sandaracinaceae bacterium]
MGFILGGIAGYVVTARMSENDGNLMVGVFVALAGMSIGVAVGISRAFALKARAQPALCLAHIEENTRAPGQPSRH